MSSFSFCFHFLFQNSTFFLTIQTAETKCNPMGVNFPETNYLLFSWGRCLNPKVVNYLTREEILFFFFSLNSQNQQGRFHKVQFITLKYDIAS